METKFTAFHWPDHNIGKRESRAIREAHNALYNSHAELLELLQWALDDQDSEVLGVEWNDKARAAIAKALGNA